jgi:hypothetical protein
LDVSDGRRAGEVQLVGEETDFKFFKTPISQCSDLKNPCVFPAAIPIAEVVAAMRGRPSRSDQSILALPKQVSIGPGKFFRPMPGLCSLFARTGTRVVSSKPKPHPISQPTKKLSPTSSRRKTDGGAGGKQFRQPGRRKIGQWLQPEIQPWFQSRVRRERWRSQSIPATWPRT